VHPDHNGVVRDTIVRYALLKPGPEPYVTGFNKNGPFKTKLVAVQNLAMMYSKEEQRKDKEKLSNIKPGGSAEVSWGASQVQVISAEKHDHRADGKTLMDTLETGAATASHFTGHQKITHVVSHEGNGAAPHFTRKREQQRAEKHKIRGSFTGLALYRTIGECTDSIWTGSGPHHLNWQKQVQTNTSGTDNGAADNFARTDSTRKPEALQGDYERSAKEDDRFFMPITEVTYQVTDVGSQTTVGSFSLRKTYRQKWTGR
jgi:hypothetical protein